MTYHYEKEKCHSGTMQEREYIVDMEYMHILLSLSYVASLHAKGIPQRLCTFTLYTLKLDKMQLYNVTSVRIFQFL